MDLGAAGLGEGQREAQWQGDVLRHLQHSVAAHAVVDQTEALPSVDRLELEWVGLLHRRQQRAYSTAGVLLLSLHLDPSPLDQPPRAQPSLHYPRPPRRSDSGGPREAEAGDPTRPIVAKIRAQSIVF